MKIITSLIILLFSILTFGQKQPEPTILILSPNETKYEKSFKKEVTKYNKNRITNPDESAQEAYLTSEEFLAQPENIQKMMKSEINFARNIDFFKNASSISEQFLAYRFFEKFPNLLIILKDEKSDGSINHLKRFSEYDNFQYVLNFKKIELYKQDNIGYAKIYIQLFDSITNSLVLEKSYTGDWNNPGFEFACESGSINCTLNNALSKALNDIIYIIASNSPTLKKEKSLALERSKVLSNNYLKSDFNKKLLETIIPEDLASSMNAYQVLYNEDESKFVAFYLEQVSPQNLKSLTNNKKDKNVKIISSSDIRDTDLLEKIPKTYAYIIKAIRYKDEWYYEKSNVTYFQANSRKEGEEIYFNNLQKWNFFKENSIDFNSDFWKSNLFEKVPDLKKDPEWKIYGESIWKTDEVNNRKYIGLYEIVANEQRKQDEKKKEEYQNELIKKIIQPKFDSLKEINPSKYTEYSKGIFIHSKNREITLNPVVITNSNGKNTMHYNILFKNSNNLYKWTYFPDETVKKKFGFSSMLMDNLKSITSWNFSYDYLLDSNFWEKYVTAKKDGQYLYLEPIIN